MSGAPRTVPSSSGHRNTVLVAALSRTTRPRGEPLFDSLGVQVIPLNDVIRNIPLSEHPDDKSYQFLNDTERTTGILGSEGLLPPRPTARIRKRLPWEAKPHIPDVLHNIMIERRSRVLCRRVCAR